MIIDCISDLHGEQPELKGGDLLIVAGDLTARDTVKDFDQFFIWLGNQNYKKIIWIAGNHDGYIEKRKLTYKRFQYLQDSGCEYEGLKIYGSPWTPTFCNWAFMKDRGADIKAMWNKIPDDIDILVTHGPPLYILDKVNTSSKANIGKHAGCADLRDAIERIKPKLHVFGHIHEQGGKQLVLKHDDGKETICVNASVLNEDYDHVNKPIRIVL